MAGTSQESRLAIVIDTRDSEARIRRLREQLRDLGGTTDDTGNNTDRLRRSNQNLNDSTSTLNKTLGASVKAFKYGAAAIAGAGVAIGALALDYASTAREIKTMSQIAGESVENLQMQAAATETVGISMEKLGDISKDTKEKIGDFLNTGGGGMQDFADAMGYTDQQAQAFAESMVGLSGKDVLQEMVNQMEAGGVNAEQMSHALEGMGSDATNLIPLLRNNGAEMKRLGLEAEQAGAVLSQVDIDNALQMGANLTKLKNKMAGVKNELMAALMPSLISFTGVMAEQIPVVVDFIKSLDFSAVVTTVTAAYDAISSFVNNAQVVSTVSAVIAGLETAWDNLKSVIERTGEIIKPVIDFFVEHEELSKSLATAIGIVAAGFVIYNAAVAIGTAVTGGFAAALALVTAPITLIVVGLTALVAAGVYVYRNWDEIKAKATAIWGSIKSYITSTIESIKSTFSGWINSAKNAVTSVKNTVINTLKALPAQMVQVGKDIVQGLINGIKSSVSGVTSAISDMASSAIAKAKSVLDIRSPSRKMKKLGEQTAQGMAVGIKKGTKKVVTEAQRMAEQAIKAVDDAIASYQKRIALFGDNSELSSLLYDIDAGKYKGASDARISQLVKEATALHNLESQLKATDLIRGRMDKFNQDKASSSTNLQGMLSGLEQETPLGKIQADYEARLELIEQYENTHTDMLETAKEARLAVEQSYMDAKRDLLLDQGEAIFGNLAGLSKAFLGEQSSMYRALFAIEKGYTLAKVLLKNKEAIAEAWASAPFPANLGAVASTVAGTAGLASAVSGIMPGFKTGGYTGNMGVNQIAGAVHGQEYVFDAQATKRIGVDNLNAMRRGESPKGGGDVNINVTVDAQGNSSVSGDNERMGRDMANGIKAVVMDTLRKEKRQGGMLYA